MEVAELQIIFVATESFNDDLNFWDINGRW